MERDLEKSRSTFSPKIMTSTSKTSLNSDFVGTNDHRNRIQNLVAKMNRVTIQATHFMKFHAIRHPNTIYTGLKCTAIYSLLNKHTKSTAANEFRESMRQFRELIGQRYENIKYFYQLAAYLGNQMASQYLTNIQEHFAQKIKGYCSAMIIKRLQDHVPPQTTRYLPYFIRLLTFT